MRTISVFVFFLILLSLPLSAYSQSSDAPKPPEEKPALPDSGQFNENPYEVGENILLFNLGMLLPITYYNPSSGNFEATNLNLPGAVFSISYLRTITTGFALGGELGGSVAGSVARRTLFMAPLSFKTALIFVMMPFEIMPTASIGGILVKLQESSHIDPFFKAGTTVFWRSSIDWSFGLNTNLWVVPQFYPEPESNRIGFFAEASLTATYHF